MKVEIRKVDRGFVIETEAQENVTSAVFSNLHLSSQTQRVRKEIVFEDWCEAQKFIRKFLGVCE